MNEVSWNEIARHIEELHSTGELLEVCRLLGDAVKKQADAVARERNITLAQASEQIQKQFSDSEQKLRIVCADEADLQDKINAAQQTKQRYQGKKRQLKQEKQQLQELEQAVQQERQQCSELEQQLSQLKQDSQAMQLHETVAALQQEYNALHTQLDALQEKKHRLEQELEQDRQQKEQLQDECSQLDITAALMRKSRIETQKKHAQLTEDRQRIDTALKLVTDACVHLQQQIDKNTNQTQRMQERQQQLEQTIQSSQRVLEEQQTKINALTQQKQQVQQRAELLAQAQQELAAWKAGQPTTQERLQHIEKLLLKLRNEAALHEYQKQARQMQKTAQQLKRISRRYQELKEESEIFREANLTALDVSEELRAILEQTEQTLQETARQMDAYEQTIRGELD